MAEQLFSYGTLQSEQVQLATFGRKLDGKSDILTGYKLTLLKIDDEAVIATSGMTHHPIIVYTGNTSDSIEGTVFTVTQNELKQADEYEVEDYKRVSVELKSGITAWVYVNSTLAQQP